MVLGFLEHIDFTIFLIICFFTLIVVSALGCKFGSALSGVLGGVLGGVLASALFGIVALIIMMMIILTLPFGYSSELVNYFVEVIIIYTFLSLPTLIYILIFCASITPVLVMYKKKKLYLVNKYIEKLDIL